MTHTDAAATVIAAEPEAVFAALVDAGARAVWLPPTGMTGRFEWFDARTGGGYRMVSTYDDASEVGKSGGNEDVADVRFAVVEAPHRVVEEVDFVSDDPAFAGTMTMTWAVEPIEAGSRVTVTATDVPDGISSADHAVAFASTLANLDAYLRGSAPAG
ncbi:SRPBCC domain-containing protein [Pseudonocardia lacus]|uniref:SRPBCC domain-containing protein n=1 Tax=Pseudonocardia lacus TaxID=2835865 RepID=UPI0027E2A12A|nr:SRPBCC domain-containing protein [Pseudonocardia lacus]